MSDSGIYLSPWRERGSDGEWLGWYGPMTAESYGKAVQEYEQSTAGGGLWDEAQNTRTGRYDTKAVLKVARSVPDRERQVMQAYWVEMQSVRAISLLLGLTVPSVRTCIQRTRKRARGFVIPPLGV